MALEDVKSNLLLVLPFCKGVEVLLKSNGVDRTADTGIQDCITSKQSDLGLDVVTEVTDVHEDESEAQD